MPYGNFYYGKDGFLYKKQGAIGARRNFPLGLICNQPADLNVKYTPGSGVSGAVSSTNYAIRRKMIRNSARCYENNCGINYFFLGYPLGYIPPTPVPPFYGNLLSTITTTPNPNGYDTWFGNALSWSSDGKLAIGAPYYDDPQTTDNDTGRVYVYANATTSSPVLLSTITTTPNPNGYNTLFGYALSWSSDGKLAIGAPYYDDPQTTNNNTGRVYVYANANTGSPVLLSTITTTPNPNGYSTLFGQALSWSSDGKLAIGAPNYDDPQTTNNNTGRVYVYANANTGSPVLLSTITTTANINGFNTWFCNALSWSSDGKLAIGAPSYDDPQTTNNNTGRVYVYANANTGSPVLLSTITTTPNPNNNYDTLFGQALSWSSDGKLAIGAPLYNDPQTSNNNTGRVYVYN